MRVLPNTAGCRTPKEAITTAQMARELFGTDWIKLEVIANDDTLQPELFGLVEAAGVLTRDGFKVFPYTTEDLGVAERLLAAGCELLMPWGAPIGTGRGLANPYALRTMRNYFPGVPLVVDAGIGAPIHAAQAMEMGYDAVLLNTAVAKAADPVRMARAFALGDRGRASRLTRRGSWRPATWPRPRRRSPARRSSTWGADEHAARPSVIDVFYPIVPDLAWLRAARAARRETIQLRLKDAAPAEVRRQIAGSLEVCRRHGCELIVNDYWREAIEAGAEFVHLGQEDLAEADVPPIKAAGLKLGISTHSHEELDIALAPSPTTSRSGPIYETKLKAMKWGPQGLDRIARLEARIGDSSARRHRRHHARARAGVVGGRRRSACAVITDFFTHADPEGRVRQWLAWARSVDPLS